MSPPTARPRPHRAAAAGAARVRAPRGDPTSRGRGWRAPGSAPRAQADPPNGARDRRGRVEARPAPADHLHPGCADRSYVGAILTPARGRTRRAWHHPRGVMRGRPCARDDRRVAGAERLTWFGHATVAIELAGARLLTDPVLRNRVAHLRRHAPPADPAVSAGVDAVLVSHIHFDHLDVPSLRRLGRSVRLLVPRGAGRFLSRAGFTDGTELDAGDEGDVGRARVTAVPAEHDGRRRPLGPAAATLGFTLAGEKTVYFAGDTDVFEGMAALAGTIDVALLPVWGWGPTLGPGH